MRDVQILDNNLALTHILEDEPVGPSSRRMVNLGPVWDLRVGPVQN